MAKKDQNLEASLAEISATKKGSATARVNADNARIDTLKKL